MRFTVGDKVRVVEPSIYLTDMEGREGILQKVADLLDDKGYLCYHVLFFKDSRGKPYPNAPLMQVASIRELVNLSTPTVEDFVQINQTIQHILSL